MAKPSYKAAWISHVDKKRSDYTELAAQDVCADWEINRMPESRAQSQLTLALYMMYANDPLGIAAQFLRKGRAVCERAFREERWESTLCARGFPHNRAVGLQISAYVDALLGEPALDRALVLESSEDHERACKTLWKGIWDDQIQSYYLTSVRLALIAGDISRARQLLLTKRKFNWHEQNHTVVSLLANCNASSAGTRDQLSRFDTFFDRVRDPDYQPRVFVERDILRFEFGILREKYFVSQDGSINWNRVIDMISQ